ncbi:hypothetical protein ACQHIH_18580 [Xanthomonas sontii]|uniref:hypothetical protein n=1 Tax=Xanthomonas sontii TaxID=2650745 RepID=UPI003F87ABC6
MKWIEYKQQDGKLIPAWKRTLGVSEETGEVFVPAAMAGEQDVLLCAAYDGTTVASNHNHVYVPASWLSREFPDTKELCDIMVTRAREALDTE